MQELENKGRRQCRNRRARIRLGQNAEIREQGEIGKQLKIGQNAEIGEQGNGRNAVIEQGANRTKCRNEKAERERQNAEIKKRG